MYGRFKVTALMATMPGREEACADAVESLRANPEIDQIRIWHNHADPKSMVKPPCAWVTAGEMTDYTVAHDKKGCPVVLVCYGKDLTDWGKLSEIIRPREGFILTCDDDLIYPPDYARETLEELQAFPGEVVGHHGVILTQPKTMQTYCRGGRRVYHCLRDVPRTYRVHILGTGVAAFRAEMLTPQHYTTKFHLSDEYPKKGRMADVWFAMWCNQNGIARRVLPHREGWIKHSTKVDLGKTIYSETVNTAHDRYIASEIRAFEAARGWWL